MKSSPNLDFEFARIQILYPSSIKELFSRCGKWKTLCQLLGSPCIAAGPTHIEVSSPCQTKKTGLGIQMYHTDVSFFFGAQFISARMLLCCCFLADAEFAYLARQIDRWEVPAHLHIPTTLTRPITMCPGQRTTHLYCKIISSHSKKTKKK